MNDKPECKIVVTIQGYEFVMTRDQAVELIVSISEAIGHKEFARPLPLPVFPEPLPNDHYPAFNPWPGTEKGKVKLEQIFTSDKPVISPILFPLGTKFIRRYESEVSE